MAFDQTHIIRSDLRPLNIVRNVVDDPRIVTVPAATAVGGRAPVVHPEIGSPGSVPVFIHGLGYTTAEVAGVAPWGPPPPPPTRVAVPVGPTAAFGYGYNPNPPAFAAAAARVGAGDVSGVGTAAAASGGPGLSPSSRAVSGEECQGPGKKVKFLCSFGGKILPRPSDGTLRYVGGHTRIVSLRKDVTFTELAQKMAETYGQSQPVYIKYQLPEEDLDALVSVSCPDDLENMMDEYEKILGSDGDGSAKLRVFLFSPSELDSSGMLDFGDLNDPNAQRYVEAVNGIVDFGKESLASVNSAHSDLSGGDGTSAVLLKQNSGNNISDDISPPMRVPVIKSGGGVGGVPRTSSPCPELPPGVEIPAPPPPYTQADYVQQVQPQMGYSGPQLLGFHGARQFIPTTMSPSHMGIRQNAVQPTVDERVYGQRVVPMPMEQSYAPYQVQVQVPSALAGGNYSWHHQAPPPEHVIYSDGLASHQPVTYSDGIIRPECYMCQKSLPHAHSDSVMQQTGAGPLSDPVPGFNSLRLDDHSRSQPMARVIVESGFGQIPEARIEKERVNNTQQLADHSIEHHPRISAPSAALLGTVGGQYLVRPDALDRAVGVIPTQTSERSIQESPKFISRYEDSVKNCVSADQMRPIESRIESLGISPTETSIEPRLVPTSRLVQAYEVAQPPLWGNPVLYAQPKAEPLSLDSNEVRGKTGDGQDCSNSLFSDQDPWNLNQDNNNNNNTNNNNNKTQFQTPKPVKSPTTKEPVVVIRNDPFGENLFGNSAELNTVEDGIQQSLDILSTRDLGSEVSQSTKGSAEEQIRNDLQSVAEGVAASVFQSSSNPDLHDDTKDLATETLQTETKLLERAHMGFPVSGVSGDIGRLQIIKNIDLEELRELGSGTFGTVYHGKWRGTDVAIKRINDRCFAGKPSEQERMRYDFWNEAINLADLHHPNVLAFYGVVLDGPGGSVATVTEYMVNGSLRNALQKNEKSVDKRKRLLIAMDVAFGMEYLHGKNIVHFDLKSDNLLVNLRDPHRPICKVGDLGLSKVKCQTLISGGVRGTLPWMAPELLNGSSSLVSEKVDVFSFGIVMWELITGEEPYADLHYGAIIGGIVSNTLRPQVPESCDFEWRAVMERCWSSEPSERPSFTEIANQLRSLAAKIPPKGQNSNTTPQQQTSSPSAQPLV